MEITFRQARLAAGFSLRGLAEATDTALSTVEAFDGGDIGPRSSGQRTPHGRTMKACADALGREVMDIAEFRAVLGVEERHEPRRDLRDIDGESELAEDIRALVQKHANREARRCVAGVVEV